MIGTYVSAIVISVVAILLGRGICVLSGGDGKSWLAAPVGFAALMVICEVAISLPGLGWTAAAVVLILCVAAVVVCRRRGAGWPSVADGLFVALPVLGITAIPFLANGRVGVLGVSVLNDTHWHLFLAQGLLQPSIRHLDDYGPGYPLGPHAVAATFARGLFSSVDRTLTGVLIATPVLTGLAALGALGDISRTRRVLVAVLAAIPYMAAAWYVQSAFKEPIMALLVVGLMLALMGGERARFARPAAVVVPLAVLTGGILYDYSYPGLIWPVAILGCWVVLWLVFGGVWRHLATIARGVRGSWVGLGIAVLILAVVVAPDLHRLYTFWQSNSGTSVGTVGGIQRTGPSSLANLPGALRTLEGFNIWLWGDFRFVPPDALQAGALAGFVVLLVAFAVVRGLERRDWPWLATLAGVALVYAYMKHSQSPYVAAKGLVVPAPVLVIGAGGALMRQLESGSWRSVATPAVAVAAAVFFIFSFQSDFLVLRDAEVGPDNHTVELRSLRPLLHGKPTIALFYDDYVKWELLGVPVSSPLIPGPIPAAFSLSKPWSYGQPIDFNSVDPSTLDGFDYAITTRSPAQSQPPPNFHLVGSSASFEVWKRVGPTPPVNVLPESGQPGAVLDCSKAADARISRQRGIAAVRRAPLYFPVGSLIPGENTQVLVHLPPGVWSLSLPFTSTQAITVIGAGLDEELPPNLDRSGEIWPVGTVHSTGKPFPLLLSMVKRGVISSGDPPSQFFTPEQLIAVPVGSDQVIPLRRACGKYVDWYQLT